MTEPGGHDGTPPTARPTSFARRLLLGCLAVTTVVAAFGAPAPATDVPAPAAAADLRGGTAARLFDDELTPLPGNVFLLIGPATGSSHAQVYDTNAYLPGEARHPDTVTSNVVANRLVRSITGSQVAVIDMTSSRSGGPSGGLARAIAYFNVVSDGTFTGELRVAATGQLDPNGYLRGIDHIDAKTAAAGLADVDVLFTPTVPTSNAGKAPAARIVGEIARDTTSGDSLHDPDRLRRLRQWGVTRPAGMDVVDVRHVIDVSAYLCGTGSAFACEVTDVLERQARQRLAQLTATARAENERLAARAVER